MKNKFKNSLLGILGGATIITGAIMLGEYNSNKKFLNKRIEQINSTTMPYFDKEGIIELYKTTNLRNLKYEEDKKILDYINKENSNKEFEEKFIPYKEELGIEKMTKKDYFIIEKCLRMAAKKID